MTETNLETTSTDTVETAVEPTDDPAKFSFDSIEQGLALYMDAMRGREAIEKELEDAIKHSSEVCESILKQFGAGPFNLGDGHPRGHIVVKRGDLYFIRARNTGRPAGSKNRAAKADGEKVVAAVSAPEAAEQVSQAAETAVAEAAPVAEESPTVTETPAVDVVQLAKTAEALVSATSQLAEALKAHSSQQSSAAE